MLRVIERVAYNFKTLVYPTTNSTLTETQYTAQWHCFWCCCTTHSVSPLKGEGAKVKHLAALPDF